MNRRLRRANGHRRRPDRFVSPVHAGCCGMRPHVGSLTERQLHEELVADAVKGHATDLARFVEACERIGALNGKGAEDAYLAVKAEVESLGARLPQGL